MGNSPYFKLVLTVDHHLVTCWSEAVTSPAAVLDQSHLWDQPDVSHSHLWDHLVYPRQYQLAESYILHVVRIWWPPAPASGENARQQQVQLLTKQMDTQKCGANCFTFNFLIKKTFKHFHLGLYKNLI